MKKWITCALLGVLPAMAMAGDGRMPVTHLGPGFMSVLDADTQHARGDGVVNAWTAIYLARSENQLAQGSNVDYMAVKADYDCKTAGRWRLQSMVLYSLERRGEPVASNTGGLNPWTVAPPNTPPYAAWEGICQNRFDGSGLEFHVQDERQDILRRYRTFLQNRP